MPCSGSAGCWENFNSPHDLRRRRKARPGSPVGAELVIHRGDLRHCGMAFMGHDRRSWRYDCAATDEPRQFSLAASWSVFGCR